jgi:prolyl 4-hydroxylase
MRHYLTAICILFTFLRTELTAQDCLFMGKHAFNAGAYARAVEWFEESYILAGLENNKTIRQDQVMEFIQHAINMVCIDF